MTTGLCVSFIALLFSLVMVEQICFLPNFTCCAHEQLSSKRLQMIQEKNIYASKVDGSIERGIWIASRKWYDTFPLTDCEKLNWLNRKTPNIKNDVMWNWRKAQLRYLIFLALHA